MNRAVVLAFFIGMAMGSKADISTKNGYTGTWSNPNSWTGAQPSPLNTNIANQENIDIYGYITRYGSLSFANLGANSYQLTIRDTLVVLGDLSFANNAISLTIPSGGLLVVFGNFVANNRVVLNNGGTMVVTQNMTLSGGNQDYTGSGGLYVDGTISGNGDVAAATAIDQPISNLNGGPSPEQNLYDFISGGGSTPLPIVLGQFSLNATDRTVEVSWTTLSEENFEYFEILRSSDGISYELIGTIEGNGFSSKEIHYKFTDFDPVIGQSYYRLNAVDTDGTEELFEPKSISFGLNQIEISVSHVAGQVQLSIVSPIPATHLVVQIINLKGDVVYQSSEVMETITFPSSGRSEIFIARIQLDNYIVTKKFLVRSN